MKTCLLTTRQYHFCYIYKKIGMDKRAIADKLMLE